MLWVLTTLLAAASQTARNAMQSGLTSALGTLGATQVRFLYGFPFALVFLGVTVAVTGEAVPAPTLAFLGFLVGGALAQILATALLLKAMRSGSFSVVTALSKTEAVQIAVFGLVILGDPLTVPGALAIVIATLGVALTALRPGAALGVRLGPVLLGVASGACFALAAVGFRGGILALESGGYWMRATTMLAWSLGLQALLLGGWLALFARPALLGSLRLWRPSLLAGFFGAFASQFWFIGFALTSAANVRTLGLVEVLFAYAVGWRVFRQQPSLRELAGMVLVVAGVGLLVASAAGWRGGSDAVEQQIDGAEQVVPVAREIGHAAGKVMSGKRREPGDNYTVVVVDAHDGGQPSGGTRKAGARHQRRNHGVGARPDEIGLQADHERIDAPRRRHRMYEDIELRHQPPFLRLPR